MRNRLEEKLDSDSQKDIDLAPLIDVVFILLIFFIVTTVFVNETGIEIEKPKAVSTETLDRNVIMLAISPKGEVFYDGASIGVAGVRSTISSLVRKRQKPVVIKSDKRVSAEVLVKVIDQVKLGGAEQVNIATSES